MSPYARRFIVLPLIFVTVLLWTGLASPPANADAVQVEQLIKLLGDGSFQVRARAQSDLEQMGAGILPLLREAAKQADNPEVRRRLEDIIPRMERAAALSPTRITMSIKDKPVRNAVQELGKKTGYTLQVYDNGNNEDRRVTLDLKDVPFWDALDRICQAGGLVFTDNWYGNNNDGMGLQQGTSYPGFTFNEGPFRAGIKGFSYNKSTYLAVGGNQGPFQRNENMSVTIGISVEPKLPIVTVGYPTLTEAVDEQNQSLLLPPQNRGESSHYYEGGYRRYTYQVQAALRPSEQSRKLKVLKGTIPVTVIAAQKPRITVDKLMEVKNKTFKDAKITINIDEVTKNGNQVTIKMSITDTSVGGNGDYGWINSLMQRLEVLDSKGNKLVSYGNSWNNSGNNSVQGTFQFGSNNGGNVDAAKLIYYEWTTMSHSVSFEFKDLPLP